MPPKKKRLDPERRKQILADAQRDKSDREKGYREQALALFPHVCGRCGREFAGKTLRELTVHHKDTDHTNNPPDGSNWELLCLYCHDNEHQDLEQMGYSGPMADSGQEPPLGHNPFEGLKNLLKPDSDETDSA